MDPAVLASLAQALSEAEAELAAGVAAPDSQGQPRARKVKIGDAPFRLTDDLLRQVNSKEGLVELLRSNRIRVGGVFETLKYEHELSLLQIELVKLQRWLGEKRGRIAILFEGRDAAHTRLAPDPNIVTRFHRKIVKID